MKVIVDTSGWYAGVVEPDNEYIRAASFFKRDHEFIIIPTVFAEIVALLQNRQSKQLAIESGRILQQYKWHKLTKEEEKSAWQLFVKSNTEVSYTDCTVITVAKILRLPVFGFDRHFTKLGIIVVPT